MVLCSIRCPYFIWECAALAFLVLEGAVPVFARLEFAHRLYVSKLASLHIAVATITTRGHVGMFEWAMEVSAVGVEFTLLLILVGTLGRRGRMATDALPILTGCAK